jgi:hypothetical protein
MHVSRATIPAAGPEGSRIIGDHDLPGRDGENEIEAIDDGGRRWYHLRAEPAGAPTFGASTQRGGWCWDGVC